MDLKYGDKILEMQGVIVDVSDGAVSIDFKGRLGYLKIPRRMIISDYELKVGQEIGLNMSFVEVLSDKINEKYVSNLEIQKRRGLSPDERHK
ncbi:CBO2463/CBO2479 domain-containing protein [Clostridium sp. Marseille-Q2269]|uniref:CBO2463/CBO2479 domain-containing protein n=1 Tax=Clostridium sp. Marseille-Q2269 TaxID=2942205 RepID=UPI002072F832|nr:CBO2463/CBO2479 domain-containing protein [Clostridium sp. Marseille-Q2269]